MDCPNCGSGDSIRRGNYYLKDGTTKVQKQCKQCGEYFSEVDTQNPKPRLFYVDIETSMMEYVIRTFSPRVDYLSHKDITKDWFVICWAGQWIGTDRVLHSVVTPKEALARDDRRVCADFLEILNEADVIIAHNGDRFDMKKLRYRFRFAHNFPPPLPYRTIDTLKIMRRVYGASSNSLDFLARMGLKIPAKLKTERQLWLDCEAGDPVALGRMDTYCVNDIHIGIGLYKKIIPDAPNGVNLALYTNMDKPQCPRCLGDIEINDKRDTTGMNAFGTYRCLECGHTGRTRNSVLDKEQRKNLKP